jgi:hypothetical protein
MGTLTASGILWAYLGFNGKVAFGRGDHVIHYEPKTGLYHLKEKGETIFAAKKAHECLEAAPEFVWDHCASHIIPSWEEDHGTEDQASTAA